MEESYDMYWDHLCDWFNKQELTFNHGCFNTKEIAYAAFLEGIRYYKSQEGEIKNELH